MKELSVKAKGYILVVMFCGFALLVYEFSTMEYFSPGLMVLAVLASVAQIFKVRGPTERSNYNLSWVLYGFSFLLFDSPGALFVILVAHLVEWYWHKVPWYIQLFNIAVYAVAIFIASSINSLINPHQSSFEMSGAIGLIVGIVLFTFVNHYLVGVVIKYARGQNFQESGVFERATLVIDITLFGLGIASAMIWTMNPYLSLLNVIPVYLLYNVLRVPALERKVEELQRSISETRTDKYRPVSEIPSRISVKCIGSPFETKVHN